jgi:hypothetical protein
MYVRGPDGELHGVYAPPDEKWPRFCAEIPPELAELLDRAQRKSLGVNATSSNATRANLVRSALRLYLNTVDPETDPDDTIEGSATDIIDLPALPEPQEPPAMSALEQAAPRLVERILPTSPDAARHRADRARAEQITDEHCPWRHREWRGAFKLGALDALRGQPPSPPIEMQGSDREQHKRRAYFAGHTAALAALNPDDPAS